MIVVMSRDMTTLISTGTGSESLLKDLVPFAMQKIIALKLRALLVKHNMTLPTLMGSEHSVAWAENIRNALIIDLHREDIPFNSIIQEIQAEQAAHKWINRPKETCSNLKTKTW